MSTHPCGPFQCRRSISAVTPNVQQNALHEPVGFIRLMHVLVHHINLNSTRQLLLLLSLFRTPGTSAEHANSWTIYFLKMHAPPKINKWLLPGQEQVLHGECEQRERERESVCIYVYIASHRNRAPGRTTSLPSPWEPPSPWPVLHQPCFFTSFTEICCRWGEMLLREGACLFIHVLSVNRNVADISQCDTQLFRNTCYTLLTSW